MKLYGNAEEMVENEIPLPVRARLYPIFEDGVKLFKEVVKEQSSWAGSAFWGNVKGHLLSFLIGRLFEPDMLSPNFPFRSAPEKVNNFGYKCIYLQRGNVLINIVRTKHANALPSRSLNRLERCLPNNFSNVILLFDVNHENKLHIKNAPYCCFLTYSIQNGELSSANLIVPDNKISRCLKKIDLKKDYIVYESPHKIEEPDKEIIIAKLRQEILDKLNNTDKGNDEI